MDLRNDNLRLVLELATTLARKDPHHVRLQFSAATADAGHEPDHLTYINEHGAECPLGQPFNTYAAYSQAAIPLRLVQDFVAPLRDVSAFTSSAALELVRSRSAKFPDFKPDVFSEQVMQTLSEPRHE